MLWALNTVGHLFIRTLAGEIRLTKKQEKTVEDDTVIVWNTLCIQPEAQVRIRWVICYSSLSFNLYIIKTYLFHLRKMVQIWPPLRILIATSINQNTFTFPLNKCFSFLIPLLFTYNNILPNRLYKQVSTSHSVMSDSLRLCGL